MDGECTGCTDLTGKVAKLTLQMSYTSHKLEDIRDRLVDVVDSEDLTAIDDLLSGIKQVGEHELVLTVSDLSAFVRKLIHEVRKTEPDNALCKQAAGYLFRKSHLCGTILRDTIIGGPRDN